MKTINRKKFPDVIEIRSNPKLFQGQTLIYFKGEGAALDNSFVTQKEIKELVKYYKTTYGLTIEMIYMHPNDLRAYNTWSFKHGTLKITCTPPHDPTP